MAAAVLRPTGSVSTRLRAGAGTCLRTCWACALLVTVQTRSGGIIGRKRATVCSSMVSFPTMFNSCLGVRVRLRGQKRVPRPPARITACVLNLSVAMCSFALCEYCLSKPCFRDIRPLDLRFEFRHVGDIGPQQNSTLFGALFCVQMNAVK